MIKQISLLFTAAVLLLPEGCTKDPALADDGLITVEAGIGAMTKVTTDGVVSSFEEGDKIAVYAWTGSAAAVPAERAVDGVLNTLGSDGKWTPASQMRWKPGTNAHYFLGVSPVRAVSDFTADAVTLSGDYAKDDLLFAKRLEGLTPGTTPVALTFSHAMAKLTVNLKVRNEFGASPAVSVSVTAKSGATVNYLTQAVTATGDASALSLTAAATAPTGYMHSFSGIQVPQEGVRRITVTVAGQDCVYEAGEDIPLASGHHTTLGLIVGKDKIELSGVSVSDWTAGSAVAGGEAKRDFTRVPLTFEAQTAGAQVSFTLASIVSGVQYSTDSWTWTDYVSGTPIELTNVGDFVMFRGDNASYSVAISASNDFSYFQCSAPCAVYGNIMSLVSSTDFATATTLTEDRAFRALFYHQSNLRIDASKELLLPATTLSNACYHAMFCGCTGLTTVPELPATTLAEECYIYMFSECTSLTTSPELPATTLAKHCYCGMFDGCTGLTTAPELPATMLADYCYSSMFADCTGLTTAPELPATTLATGCYQTIFYHCSDLTTAPELPATTMAENCYEGMFQGCTSLTTSPELPATTLANGCYGGMFYGCTSLTTSPELPATTMKEYCYREMFVSCDLTRGPDLPATALAVDCYEGMFRNCSSLTTAPALPATTLVQGCYGDMFNGCDQLTEAPVLPAETLADYCYLHMFSDCINLNRVVCLATDISATGCTDSWLQNVAATGTFITPYETGWTLDSEDGIPFGWTRIDSAPLTFEAIVAGAQVKFGIMDDLPNPVYYRTWDGTAWSSWAEYEDYTPVTLTHIGNKVQFKGDNAAYSTWDELHGVATSSYFNLSGDCYVFGNIMSLINSTDYYSLVTLEADNTFIALFCGCNSYLKINAARPLNLPATTLSKRCYWKMFADCSGMTVAPELPAATLTEDCYGWMFVDCTNLSSVTCLATDITALRCTNMWLWQVSGTGTFTTRTGTGWTTSNLEGIPTGWNRVDLP